MDDQGDSWPEASRNLGLALKTKRSGAQLTDFLVRQMGFVIVREFPGRHELVFDPAVASPVALTAFLYWEAEKPFLPTSFKNPAEPNLPVVFHKRLALLNLVGAAIEARAERPTYELLPTEIDLSPFAASWRGAVEVCRTDIPSRSKLDIFEQLFRGRYIVASRSTSCDYAVDHAGSHFHRHEPEFCATVLGTTFRACMDQRYGAWTADHFMSYTGDQRPATSSLAAEVAPGKLTMLGKRRVFYDRLVIPHRQSCGTERLLIAVNLSA